MKRDCPLAELTPGTKFALTLRPGFRPKRFLTTIRAGWGFHIFQGFSLSNHLVDKSYRLARPWASIASEWLNPSISKGPAAATRRPEPPSA